MMRSGGFSLSMVLICTGLVCVRSTAREPSGASREIEGIVVLPRRMLGRNVQRGEIVEVGLDVGTLGDRESHIGEDLGDLVGHLAHRMNAALGERPEPNREGDVGALERELLDGRRLGQLGASCLERLADGGLQAIHHLAIGLALFRRQRSERLHQLGDAALAAERGDADLFQLGEVRGFRDGVKQLGLEAIELQRAHGERLPGPGPSPACRGT